MIKVYIYRKPDFTGHYGDHVKIIAALSESAAQAYFVKHYGDSKYELRNRRVGK